MRAATAGVKRMLSVGTSHKSSSQAVSLAESNFGVFASVGVHPHYARSPAFSQSITASQDQEVPSGADHAVQAPLPARTG